MTGSRRTFLHGLASLPLIGGGLTLIGRPATAVPLAHVAAAPILGDPRERAQYAWAAFSAAMREITAGSHGWVIRSGGERMPFRSLPGNVWLDVRSVHYEADTEPRSPSFIVEHHRHIDLDGGAA